MRRSLLSEFSRRRFAGQLFFPSSSLVYPPLSLSKGTLFFLSNLSRKPKKNPQKNPKNPLQKIPFILSPNPLHCAVCGRFSFNRLFPRSRLVASPISPRFASLLVCLRSSSFRPAPGSSPCDFLKALCFVDPLVEYNIPLCDCLPLALVHCGPSLTVAEETARFALQSTQPLFSPFHTEIKGQSLLKHSQ